jgi:hypothetical protein
VPILTLFIGTDDPLEFRSEDVDEGVNHVDYLVRNFIYRLHNVSKQLSISTMLWKRVIESSQAVIDIDRSSRRIRMG